jgi:hypothetical protein
MAVGDVYQSARAHGRVPCPGAVRVGEEASSGVWELAEGGWARDGRDEPHRGEGREVPWHTNVAEEAQPVEGGQIFPYDATRAASDPFYLSFLSLLRSQSFDLI